MNKYQRVILDKCNFTIDNDASLIINGEVLTIKQCANAYVTKFVLSINTIALQSITINKEEIPFNDNNIDITIDFEHPVKKIMLNPIENITDPIELKIIYEASDKVAYDENVKKERIKEYTDKMNAHLIHNIFGAPIVIFNPCCEDYGYTEVEFIATNSQGTIDSVFPTFKTVSYGTRPVIDTYDKNENFNIVLERKKNKAGCNYITFEPIGRCGLKAHIYQYDKKGNLLIDLIVN